MRTITIITEMRTSGKYNRQNIRLAASMQRMSVRNFLRYYIAKVYCTGAIKTAWLTNWAYLRYYILK